MPTTDDLAARLSKLKAEYDALASEDCAHAAFNALQFATEVLAYASTVRQERDGILERAKAITRADTFKIGEYEERVEALEAELSTLRTRAEQADRALRQLRLAGDLSSDAVPGDRGDRTSAP